MLRARRGRYAPVAKQSVETGNVLRSELPNVLLAERLLGTGDCCLVRLFRRLLALEALDPTIGECREANARLRPVVAFVELHVDLPESALRFTQVPPHSNLVRLSPLADDEVIERPRFAGAAFGPCSRRPWFAERARTAVPCLERCHRSSDLMRNPDAAHPRTSRPRSQGDFVRAPDAAGEGRGSELVRVPLRALPTLEAIASSRLPR